MKKARSFLALFLVLILALSLVSCAKPTDSDNSADPNNGPQESQNPNANPGEENNVAKTAADTIQAGTVFRYWINYDVPLYLPWSDNRGQLIAYQCFDNLLYRSEMKLDDIRGNLAESWDVSDDGLVWTFQIRQDATFTSGNPVNAEAFVKSWDVAKEYQGRYFGTVESYEATGEYELTIKLSKPTPTFIYELPMTPSCGIVDPAALEQYGPEDNNAAVGCGPYYIDSYIPGEGFILKANESYNHPERLPHIETCELTLIPDENTALIALMNGELDCINTVNIEAYNVLEENGWEIIENMGHVNPFWFNAREVEIFRDYTVREALCHMIDWKAVNDLVYDGKMMETNSYWPDAAAVPYGDQYTYDPELGIKMLEDAGYTKDDIKFTLLADPDWTDVNTAIVAQFNKLGFNNIDTVTYDGSTCYGMLKAGTYECFPCQNGQGAESPLTVYTMGLIPEGTQRCVWMEYMDEDAYAEALAEYDAALASTTFEEYLEHNNAITKICQDQCVAMGGLRWKRFFGLNPDFEGLHLSPQTSYTEFYTLYSIA